MNTKFAIFAALSMSVAAAVAGVSTVSYTGKEQPAPPPPLDPCAGPISYSNIELLYAHTNWGFGDSTGGGILRVEYSPVKYLYLTASAEYGDLNSYFYQDVWDFSVGLGGYFPLTENIHLAADVGYVNRRYDNLDDNGTLGDALDDFWDTQSDSGWYARPHLRAKWGCLTVHAGAIYRNSETDNDNDLDGDFFDGGQWSYFAKLYYQLHSNWDVTAGFLSGENDFKQYTAGVRYRF